MDCSRRPARTLTQRPGPPSQQGQRKSGQVLVSGNSTRTTGLKQARQWKPLLSHLFRKRSFAEKPCCPNIGVLGTTCTTAAAEQGVTGCSGWEVCEVLFFRLCVSVLRHVGARPEPGQSAETTANGRGPGPRSPATADQALRGDVGVQLASPPGGQHLTDHSQNGKYNRRRRRDGGCYRASWES